MLESIQKEGKVVSGQCESDEHDDASGGSKTFLDRDWNKVKNITGGK